MNMKKLIESMDHIEECGMVDEGPMAAMAPPAPEDKGNPVTVNVSMNASGKEHVADLLDMMKNAGLGDAKPAADAIMPMRQDMERLSAMMDEPEMEEIDDEIDADEAYSPGDENAEGMVSNCCSAPVQDEREGTGRCSACGEGCEAVAEESVEEADYANEPDAQYGDMSDAIPDGNDLNRKKKAYAATQDGDNPMAVENIKAALYAALTEKKMSEGELPAALKAYQDKKKGKAPAKGKSKSGKMPMDAGKDGKKGTKDDKPAFLKKEEMTAEGRGKVMAGRGRGKDKLMAGRGRGKKK